MPARTAHHGPLVALTLCACAGSGRPAPAADTTAAPVVNVAIAMPDLPDVPVLPDVVAARDVAAPVDAPRSAFAGETITVLSHQVAVYHAPRVDTSWFGSLRAGAQVRVVDGPIPDDGCPAFEGRPDTGWYEIERGGFVCVSRGATLTRHLRRIARSPRPTQPHRDAAMPYLYAMASRDAVLYRALPTDADEQSIEPERFHDMGDVTPTSAPPPRTLEELEGFEGTPVLRRVARGMFVSLDRPQRSETDTPFWRTLAGGWVRAADVQFVGAPGLHGVRLDATVRLPLRLVTAAQASLYRPNARGVMTRGRRAARWSALPAGDAAPVTVRDDTFVATSDGWYARRRDVTDVTAHAPPDDLAPGERWVDVNLDHQFVVAYEGATPVFATLMSSGIPSREGASYETVQGSFRLEQKHLTTTMDGNATSGAYSIEDVPWVMYFRDSFALHGAFWHSGFGAVRSHGCVNLSPDDARWLFHWTSPTLPDGWHAVFATERDPGTRVYVHYDRQRLGDTGGPAEVPGH